MSRFDDSFAALFEVARSAFLGDVKVAFPAEVVSYDAAKQTVDVRPLLADYFSNEQNDVDQVFPGVIPDVPVLHPGAGGAVILFPVGVGDTVELLVNDRSLDAWLAQGGRQAPDDLRRHHMKDAVAILGLHDSKHPWPNAPTDHLEMGMATGPRAKFKASTIELGNGSDAVALASKVDAALASIVDALTAGITAALAGDGGHAALVAVKAYLATSHPFPSTGSATVKVQP